MAIIRTDVWLVNTLRIAQIDRIQGEKKQLELQAINNRDYAKKIEQRFFMGTKGQVDHSMRPSHTDILVSGVHFPCVHPAWTF